MCVRLTDYVFGSRETSVKQEQAEQFSPCELVTLGGDPDNQLYGAWQACSNMLSQTPTIWSFGVGCDVTFEIEALRRYPNADIKSFDPTIDRNRFDNCAKLSGKAIGVIVEPKRMAFFNIGLSNESRSIMFARSADPKIGSKSSAAGAMDLSGPYRHVNGENYSTVKTLSDLYSDHHMHILGRQTKYTLDILKMDIEGSEFDVIMSWCGQEGNTLKVKQVLVEFHERMFGDGKMKRFMAYKCMRSLGYCAFFENPPKKEEVLFVHLPELESNETISCPTGLTFHED